MNKSSLDCVIILEDLVVLFPLKRIWKKHAYYMCDMKRNANGERLTKVSL